jgi:hypothetical protein
MRTFCATPRFSMGADNSVRPSLSALSQMAKTKLAATFNKPAGSEKPRMNWTKLSGFAMAAVLIAAPVTARADCGDPSQSPCTGPVPTVDQVVAIMAELTDPDRPAASKTDIVTPGFTPEEAGTIDDHLNRMREPALPLPFVVTDIVPAPNNYAGATVTATGNIRQRSAPEPIVLIDQNGHWLITHDTAWTTLDNFWYNAQRHFCGLAGGVAVYCRS